MLELNSFMDKFNFYFTGPLNEGHYRWPWTVELNQDFLKENILKRFRNSNFIDSHFEKIAKHLESFYKSGKEGINTDVAGIIVPIRHGDINDYFHIAVSIPGDFEKNLTKIWHSNGIYEEHPEDILILEKRANLTYDFMKKTFNIPVFEAHKFLPGYREIPFPVGKEDMPYKERMNLVQIAFDKWLDVNFSKKV